MNRRDEEQYVEMPFGARLISVGVQGEEGQPSHPVVWAEVNPGMRTYSRQFFVIYTGDPIPDQGAKFVGTAQLSGGIVVHIYATA